MTFFCTIIPGLIEGSCVQYACDSTMKVVFTSSQPSIVVSYDPMQGTHSVWALRKVTHDVGELPEVHKNRRLCSCWFEYFHQERSTVLRYPTEPGGTLLGLMASGFLTSHLRNTSRLDSPGGCGAAGGPGTGSRCRKARFLFLYLTQYFTLLDPVFELWQVVFLHADALICCLKACLIFPFVLLFLSSFAVGSPLHYSALHSHQSRIVTSSPGVHSRVHSPSISNMAALRWLKRKIFWFNTDV